MKKRTHITRALACVLALVLLTTALTACGGGSTLSGTYRSNDLIAQAFTFSGDTVMMSAFGINANGHYTISGDTIEITYSLFGMDYTWSQSFSRDGSSIFIGGTEFIKQ